MLFRSALLALLGVRGLGAGRQAADGRAGRRGMATDGSEAGSPATVTVTLRATAPVWARARVDGRVAYEGLLAGGDQRSFTARRAVDLRLGNAGGAQLTVDGRPRGAPGRSGQIWQGRFVPARGQDR